MPNMYFRFISYLKFIFRSTNEHDVHSPFVFSFVTKCLYDKKKLDKKKSINVLLKCIYYFKSENVCVLDDLLAAQSVAESFSQLTYDNQKYDALFAHQFDSFHFKQLLSEGKLHNDSVIIIDGIHQNSQQQKQWKALIQLPSITVSIDMFHLGVLFIRKEQEKEHFTIRI